MTAPTWSIEVDPSCAPADTRAEFERICGDVAGTPWCPRLVDTSADIEDRAPRFFAVLTRFVPRKSAGVSETPADFGPENRSISAGQSDFELSGQNLIWEGENGRAGGPVFVPAESGAESGGPGVAFGDLATVRAMSTGETRHVIGFDTEFTGVAGDPGTRIINSYQFSCIDPLDDDTRVDVVILPLVTGERLYFEDGLYIVSLATGLHVLARGDERLDPRGVKFRDIRAYRRGSTQLDYKRTLDRAFKHSVPIVLACHYAPADLTGFFRPPPQRHGGEKYNDVLRRVTSASGGWVSLMPMRVVRKSGFGSDTRRWLPFSVILRDTMGQVSPKHKSLKAVGEVCGVPKLDIGDDIADMSSLRRNDLLTFLEYGANDSVIVLEYLTMLWGLHAVPPVTISGGGARAVRDGVMRCMGLSTNAEFLAAFRGLVKKTSAENDGNSDDLSYYAVRELVPVDGDANQTHSAWKAAFHGGWNACLAPGCHPYATYDHDIQSAYPSAMAAIPDVDYVAGCIDEVVKDRDLTLDDFPLGPITPIVAYVSWEFPEDCVAPCLPVVSGDSVIYPRTSVGAGAAQGDDVGDDYEGFHGAWCAGPELYLALQLGARVTAQIGYRMRVLTRSDGELSRSLRYAMRSMVEDRALAKHAFGKGSLEELTLKVAANSCYGKLAQDVSERSGWDSWEEEMTSIGGSSITSPYHATMITSLVRALLLGVANEIPILSVTTDGFISPEREIEHLGAFGIAEVFRDAREALSGDRTVWEIKHHQDDLLNFSTRGNVSLLPHGVLAHAGVKTPAGIDVGSAEDRVWFRETALSREGKICNPYTSFPTTRELTRSVGRVDFHPVDRSPEVSTVDFDLKRQPLESTLRVDDVDGYELAGFETRAWDSVTDYVRARGVARHMQQYRRGTSGEDRPTGCLRTGEDWATFFKRVNAVDGRRIRDLGSAALTELVAAHKGGVVYVDRLSVGSVDERLDWLSSLGLGAFTRAQWDHMSKRARRDRVLASADLDVIADLVDELNAQ